jgi:hypothetical protein
MGKVMASRFLQAMLITSLISGSLYFDSPSTAGDLRIVVRDFFWASAISIPFGISWFVLEWAGDRRSEKELAEFDMCLSRCPLMELKP